METSTKKITDTLNHLIAIAEDGKEGYKNAAKDVEDLSVKTVFEKYSNQRAMYIMRLQEQVNKLGASASDSGGPLGALHRTWMDMKSIFTSGDRNAIINACVTGEEAAVKNYQEALKDEPINGDLKVMLTEQLAGIEHAIIEIKSKLIPS